MTTMQVQKSIVTTKTAIDQKQSLEIVQTLLHGGLSTLTYLRNFFDEKAFDEQCYDMSDRVRSYEEFAAGQLCKTRSDAQEPMTVVQVLRRGRSRRADVFLDWLENGAYTALKAGHLKALQIYVHADRKDRQKVIETYTFTIKYEKGADKAKKLAGLQVDGPGAVVSVEATNSALQSLMRQIMATCNELPDLPPDRFLSMEIFYMPQLNEDYQPRGFIPNTDPTLLLAHADGWQRQTDDFDELMSGFHRSSLRITSLRRPTNRNFAHLIPSVIPPTLKYNISSKEEMIGLGESAQGAVSAKELSEDAETVTPSTVMAARAVGTAVEESMATPGAVTPAKDRRVSLRIRMQNGQAESARQPAAQSQGSQQTQLGAAIRMQTALQGMMHTEQVTQGDTQTQGCHHPPGRSQSSTSTAKLCIAQPDTEHINARLSSTKALQLSQDKQRLKKLARETAKRKGRRRKSGHLVRCQCGCELEEGDMVECAYCNSWQHLHCYGYLGVEDPRVPDEHTCYRCLLGDDEQATLATMKGLALKRRAMFFASQHGLKTQRDFATDMEMDEETAGPIFQHLKSAKYVLPASGGHKAGYAKSGKPLLVAVREGPYYEGMLSALFDPLLHISHHYQQPTEPSPQSKSLTRGIFASQRDMPPPATPASQLRKRNAATPASGLDLRPSMTPYQTPSRPQRPAKRSIAHDVEASGSKRLKSVHTRMLLDANGQPSSPAVCDIR